VSWKALDWATDSQVGSSTTKFILLLLANKADERFSCYPSIRTLIAESDAGRSTVIRALNELEARGFLTRQPQFHDSGARRSSRYYLSHPLAPHCSRRPNPGPPSRFDTGPGSTRDGAHVRTTSHRGAKPLGPPSEPPSQPPADATSVLRAMPQPWRVGGKDARNLIPAIEAALASGWTTENLTAHLSRSPGGVRNPVRVLDRRLADLPDAPAESRPELTTGIRRGQICGLKWSAVDLDAGEITVHDSRVVVAGHARDKAGGKTENADQTISIDRATVAALRRWRKRHDGEREFFGTDYHPGDYVFTFEDGRPPHPDTIRQRFDRLAAAGLSRITFHDLRHSYATGALKAGVSPKILSKRIGHADVGFFLQTYAHVITNDDREAAEQAASFLIGDGWDPEPDDKQA
jgi:integrase